MKNKEKLLNIDVKHMALTKKHNRRANARGHRKNNNHLHLSTAQGTINSPRLSRQTTDLTEQPDAQSSQGHLTMVQRTAWTLDLVNIAAKGKIERGASMNWTYWDQNVSVDRVRS